MPNIKKIDCDETTYKSYDYDDKKRLVYRIQNIKNKKNYYYLYKLVENKNVKFTKNSNGIFFNINKLSNENLQQIDLFLDNLDRKTKLIQDSELSNNDTEDIFLTDECISSSVKLNKVENNIIKKKLFIN